MSSYFKQLNTGGSFRPDTLSNNLDEVDINSDLETKDLFPLWIFHPYEPIRLGWDAIITIVTIYVLFAIPVQMCFLEDIPASFPFQTLDLTVDSFFLVDIVFNFSTGYVNSESQFISSRRSIALKYFKEWFWIDLITSVPLGLIQELDKVAIFSKILKAVRVIRLLRLMKVMHLISKWESGVDVAFFTVAKFLLLIFVTAHTLACFFVGIEKISRSRDHSIENFYGFQENSWFVRYSHTYDEKIFVKYLRALYWAFTTLTTVGYGDITPLLPFEILLTIFVELIGTSLFGFIIGHVASIMTSKDSTAVMVQEKIEAVHNYIHYRQIPHMLANKIKRHYGYAWQQSQVFKEGEILLELPQGLRTECAVFIHKNIIKTVPFLSKLSDEVLPSLVTRLKPALASQSDVITLEGIFGNEMYFVTSGKLTAAATTFLSGIPHIKQEIEEIRISEIHKGDCFSEYAVILDQIRHPITVIAACYCDLFFLTRSDFVMFGETFPLIAADIVRNSKNRYFELLERVMKKRQYHTFMVSLALKNSDRALFQATLESYLQKSTLLRQNTNETLSQSRKTENMHPAENVNFNVRRLSLEMKSAPIVPFQMRLHYNILLKKAAEQQKHPLPSRIQRFRARFSSGELQRRPAQIVQSSLHCLVDLFKEKPKAPDLSNLFHSTMTDFPPKILLKILIWKDRAQLRVIQKKFLRIENQFLDSAQQQQSASNKCDKEPAEKEDYTCECKRDIIVLKSLVFSVLGGIKKQQETMKTDIKELKQLIALLMPCKTDSN